MQKLLQKLSVLKLVIDDEAMDDIILASDVIMVARGDLGVEIGDPDKWYRKLTAGSRQLNRVVITATK